MVGTGGGGNDPSSCGGSSGAVGGGGGGDSHVASLRIGDMGVLVGERGDDVPGGLGTGGGGVVYSLIVTRDASRILCQGQDMPMTLINRL